MSYHHLSSQEHVITYLVLNGRSLREIGRNQAKGLSKTPSIIGYKGDFHAHTIFVTVCGITL